MTHYLIEFRFRGKASKDLKKLIHEVDDHFKLKKIEVKRPVPHITIVAPFITKNQARLVHDFKQVCENHPFIRFTVSGFGSFANAGVVYADINPSLELILFRKDLINKLKSYCALNRTDIFSFLGIFKIVKSYHPHATIAIDKRRFEDMRDYINRKKMSKKRYTCVRATLIKNNRILYEYDFLLKRLLNRREAKSKRLYSKTLHQLKNN